MKKTLKAFLIILGCLVLVALMGFTWSLKDLKMPQANNLSQSPSIVSPRVASLPTPTPTSQRSLPDTANWKIYKNEEYGLEFKYPPDWTIQVERNIDIEGVLERINIGKEFDIYGFSKEGIIFDITPQTDLGSWPWNYLKSNPISFGNVCQAFNMKQRMMQSANLTSQPIFLRHTYLWNKINIFIFFL